FALLYENAATGRVDFVRSHVFPASHEVGYDIAWPFVEEREQPVRMVADNTFVVEASDGGNRCRGGTFTIAADIIENNDFTFRFEGVPANESKCISQGQQGSIEDAFVECPVLALAPVIPSLIQGNSCTREVVEIPEGSGEGSGE